MKHLYVIYVNPGEYTRAEPAYIAESLEEAKAKVMNYADWYCQQGTCEVRKVTKGLDVIARYRFDGGTLVKTEYTYVAFDTLGKTILWKGSLKDCRQRLKNLQQRVAPEDKERFVLLNLDKEDPTEQ